MSEPGEAIDEYLAGLLSGDPTLVGLLGRWQDGTGASHPSVFNAEVPPPGFSTAVGTATYPAVTFNPLAERWVLANGPQRCAWQATYEVHAIAAGYDPGVLAPILSRVDALCQQAPTGQVTGISPRDAARRPVTLDPNGQAFVERLYRYTIWAQAH